MSIIKINALSIREGAGDDFLTRFAARPGRIEAMEGFEGFQALRPTDGRQEWLVVTRWRDEAAYAAWTATRTPRDPASVTYATGSEVWSYDLVEDAPAQAAATEAGVEPAEATAGQVEHASDAGTSEGQATVTELVGRASSRGGRPGAASVLETDGAKIVAFEFATGDVLAEHAARHPVLIAVLRGRVRFTLPDRDVELAPGEVLHLTPMLRHSVEALEDTTLTVTMLLPRG